MSKEDKDGVVTTSQFDNSKNIRVTYEDENAFNKLAKALKKYNMFAYKDFIFNLMYQLRDGKMVGEEIEPNIWRCDLQSDKIFEFVYGKMYFTYRVEDGYRVVLLDMEPKDLLLDGHPKQLSTYKGDQIRGNKERFKIDIYNNINNIKKKIKKNKNKIINKL